MPRKVFMYAVLRVEPEAFEATLKSSISGEDFHGHYYGKPRFEVDPADALAGWSHIRDHEDDPVAEVMYTTCGGNSVRINRDGLVTVEGKRHGIPWCAIKSTIHPAEWAVMKAHSRERWHPWFTRDMVELPDSVWTDMTPIEVGGE